MKQKLIAWSVLVSLMLTAGLAGCKETVSVDLPDETKSAITVIRTKTPQLPFDENAYKDQNLPNNSDGSDDSIESGEEEMGAGLELDGYVQLLSSIDRESLSAPSGWDRHSVSALFDGLLETTDRGSNKYGTDRSALTVSWSLKEPLILNAYTVVTANDTTSYPDRNPQKWTVSGSEDGENWVVLDSVENADLPTENYLPVTYYISNDKPYRYYQWNIEETVGKSSFQAAELLLYTLADSPIQPTPDGEKTQYDTLPEYGASLSAAAEADPLTGSAAEEFLSSHKFLQSLVLPMSLYIDAPTFSDGVIEQLFDGIYTAEDFYANGKGKMGAVADQAQIVWQMSSEVTLGAYAFVTGNDTSIYSDRNPVSWALYGSEDGKEWRLIDAVSNGKLEALDFAPYVYTIAEPQAYTYYCLTVEQANGSFQLCELLLIEK